MRIEYKASDQVRDIIASLGRTEDVRFSPNNRRLAITAFRENAVGLFDVDITVTMIVMVVIGGAGTVLGPLVGAVGLQFVSEYLRQAYPQEHILVLGAVIVLVVLLFPAGLLTAARDAVSERRVSPLETIRTYRL